MEILGIMITVVIITYLDRPPKRVIAAATADLDRAIEELTEDIDIYLEDRIRFIKSMGKG